jgi:hypothetical protein
MRVPQRNLLPSFLLCSVARRAYTSALTLIRNEDIMPAATATKTRPPPEPRAEPRLFHARMLVTRAEEWCVEAETPEQARELLAAGAGHRCTPGESVQVELDRLLDQ